jgi:hypothetical protein
VVTPVAWEEVAPVIVIELKVPETSTKLAVLVDTPVNPTISALLLIPSATVCGAPGGIISVKEPLVYEKA